MFFLQDPRSRGPSPAQDVRAEVGGLGPGNHVVPLVANLPAGLALVATSPATVGLVVGLPATSPVPSAVSP